MKREIIVGIGLSCLALGGQAKKNMPPNIVFILADDMGWSALSECMDKNYPNSRSDYYQTPNLNRILKQGMRFSNGYASSPVSSPTRYSLQTGMNPSHINHVKVGQSTSHIDHATLFSIPKMLKAADPSYVCAHFGKWHLGCDPALLGYDLSDGNCDNLDGDKGIETRYPSSGKDSTNTWLYINLGPDPKSVFSLTDRSIRFIEEQKAAGRPFYLQLSHYATHKELVSTPESYALFNGLPRGEKHKMAQYAAMLWDMDVSIGKLLDRLEQLGLMKNTYIFFMADNGGVPFFPPGHPDKELKKGMGDNSPLQRGKWDVYEGGLRVPFLMVGPGIKAGSQCDVPVIAWDWLPTVAEIAGYKKALPEQIDGRSFLPLVKGEKTAPERSFFFHYPVASFGNIGHPAQAIRRGDWKLIKYTDNDQVLLFNLRNDLSEQNDLSAAQPAKTKELRNELEAYAAKYKTSEWNK